MDHGTGKAGGKEWDSLQYGPERLEADVEYLQRRNPFLEVKTIGYSVAGRPIRAIRFGSGPALLQINASVHANEWITSLLLMRFAYELAEAALPEAGGHAQHGQMLPAEVLAKQVKVWLVPMVNPDGVELVLSGPDPASPLYADLLRWHGHEGSFHDWKANLNGVDLNDQFPAHWEDEVRRRGLNGPGPRDYPGSAPLSEPEARALADFTEAENFDMVVALHTQGEEIYWNYRGLEPPVSERIALRLAGASGYNPVKLTESDAGFKDWFIQRFNRPGFTIEAGRGVNPLPVEEAGAIYSRIKPLLVEALKAAASLK
ncbi:M14 family metallopeptidase [Paenibacillus beijingensis]|uniref:Peptidase M14 domain-containing protein n=1 Tax=Paenibacillus beijingensis TaxID=1126833 RepID=A0A0D5NDD3_9BACL|nr:M14 family metallocarboxypeptidase [Paenibacillus beijingensis]AJY73409.1 hypothetical protein VN24_00655 [Paenibacillus beijingensis]